MQNSEGRSLDHADEFRRCMIDLDVDAVTSLWRHVAPHLAKPMTQSDTLAALHVARTQAQSIPPRLRFYSHRWLLDHGLPSHLSDELKPSAERMYPRIVDGVGISVNSKYPEVQRAVSAAMSHAVMDAYAERRTAPGFVRSRMQEARLRELRSLGLIGRTKPCG